MRKYYLIALIILYIASLLYGFSWAGDLISAPSDIAVAFGFVLICLLLLTVPLFRKLLNKIK